MKRQLLTATMVTALTAVSVVGCNPDREVTAPGETGIGGISAAVAIGGVATTACGPRYTADSVWPECVLKPTDVEQPTEPISDNPPTGGGSGSTGDTGANGPTDPTDATGATTGPCPKDPITNACITTPVDTTELDRVKAAISRMKVDTEYCAGAKWVLQDMANKGVAGGRFRGWSGTWTEGGLTVQARTDYAGNVPSVLINRKYLGSTVVIAHEGIHVWLNWLAINNNARWRELMAPYEGIFNGRSPGDNYIYDGNKDQQCVQS